MVYLNHLISLYQSSNVSSYTLSAISYVTVPEIQKLHHFFGHCSFAFQVDGLLLSSNQKRMAKYAQRHT